MERPGISERVALTISDHRIRNVFERYNIMNGQDLEEAARKRPDFIKSQNEAVKEEFSTGTNLSQLPNQPFESL